MDTRPTSDQSVQPWPSRRVGARGLLIASAVLVIALGQPVLAHGAPASRSVGRPVLADLNGNRISDDFESELAKAQAGARFRVIVRFTATGSEASAKQAVGSFDVYRRFSLIRGVAATMTAAQIRALSALAGTFRIEKDFTVKATMDAARHDFGVDAAQADFSATGAGIEICVVDTGVAATHEQLDNGKVVAFVDYVKVPPQTTPYDDHGHGTHVSSIAAGDGVGGANASTYRGVAPAATISAAKVLAANGTGDDADVLAGVQWCADRASVDIISMSLGSESPSDGSDSLTEAVDNAILLKNKIVVAAAGNSGDYPETVVAPGASANAITVGSVAEYSAPEGQVNHSDGIYLDFFSSRGPVLGHPERIKPDIVSPGDTIMAANSASSTGYIEHSGTSMATPFVSGVIALGLEVSGGMSPATAKSLVQSTAQDWGPAGKDNDWGSGLIDAAAFVAQAAGSSATTQFPSHTRVTGSVSGGGQWTYQFDLAAADLGTPIGATIILDGQASCALPVGDDCWLYGEWEPDLDAQLEDPNGAVIDSTCALGAECGLGRQETLHMMPTVAGTYTIRVYPFSNQGGTFALDLSRGPAGDGGPPPPPPNNPPVANAGNDQTVSDADANGSEQVTLDGSQSGDGDGTIDSYVWKEGTATVGTGVSPVVTLPIGTHTLILTVTDDDGATASDQVVVSITRAAATVHVGDIDSSRKVGRNSWQATVTITLHTATEATLTSGTVTGMWSGGSVGTCSLNSHSKGKCSITKTGIAPTQANITFMVTNVTVTGLTYAQAYNHDPDGSSNGTSILIVK